MPNFSANRTNSAMDPARIFPPTLDFAGEFRRPQFRVVLYLPYKRTRDDSFSP
jgi:hypothetical protein